MDVSQPYFFLGIPLFNFQFFADFPSVCPSHLPFLAIFSLVCLIDDNNNNNNKHPIERIVVGHFTSLIPNFLIIIIIKIIIGLLPHTFTSVALLFVSVHTDSKGLPFNVNLGSIS